MTVVDMSNLKAGDEVNSWCTKCLEMRLHKVKALVKDKPPRVVCMCPEQKERNYRPNPPGTRTKRSGSTTTRKAKPSSANPWSGYNDAFTADVDSLRKYTIHDSYTQGEAFMHKRFGLGFVHEVLDDAKIMVAFEDQARLLVCNR